MSTDKNYVLARTTIKNELQDFITDWANQFYQNKNVKAYGAYINKSSPPLFEAADLPPIVGYCPIYVQRIKSYVPKRNHAQISIISGAAHLLNCT